MKSNSQNQSAKSSLALSFYTFLSRILGLVRDHYMAVTFGTGMIASAFSIAYRLPNMFRNFLAEGTLSQSFMPLYSEYGKKGDEEAGVMAGAVISFLFFVLSVLVIGFWLTAPYFIPLIAGGNKEYSDIIIELSYILFFLIMTASLSSLFMAISNTQKKYFVPSLSPIILNLSYLLAFIAVLPFIDDLLTKIRVLCFFIVAGGISQFLLQAFYVRKLGLFPKINFRWRHSAIRKIFRMMIPAVVGGGFYQISLLVDIFLANYVQNANPGLGAVVSLDYSQRLVQLPTGIIGVALATTILPELLASLREGKKENVVPELMSTIGFSLYITLPAMFGLVIMGRTVLDSIYFGGRWDSTATIHAMQPLFFYSLAIPFFSMNKILTSSYYAFKDTDTPLKINSWAFALNITFNLILIQFLKHEAIAISSLLSAAFTSFLLGLQLKKHAVALSPGEIFGQLSRILLPLAAMVIWCLLVEEMFYTPLHQFLSGSHASVSRIILVLGIVPAIFLYFFLSAKLKIPQYEIIGEKFVKKRQK